MPKGFGVIAGELRGMRLDSPPQGITRPLRAAVKKSLFDRLSYDLMGSICLDLYAGSGSIGIEAISRGARGCTFVESDRAVFNVLKKNMDKAKGRMDNDAVALRAVRSDVIGLLEAGPAPEGPFDMVFLDPPFASSEDASKCLGYLASDEGWMKDDGIVIYHFQGKAALVFEGWAALDLRTYGDSSVVILNRTES